MRVAVLRPLYEDGSLDLIQAIDRVADACGLRTEQYCDLLAKEPYEIVLRLERYLAKGWAEE